MNLATGHCSCHTDVSSSSKCSEIVEPYGNLKRLQGSQAELGSTEKPVVCRGDPNPAAIVTKSQGAEVDVECLCVPEISIFNVHGDALAAISWDANWAW